MRGKWLWEGLTRLARSRRLSRCVRSSRRGAARRGAAEASAEGGGLGIRRYRAFKWAIEQLAACTVDGDRQYANSLARASAASRF